MKKKLLKLLNAKNEARNALIQRGETTEDVNELRNINSQIQSLDSEIGELRDMIDDCSDDIGGDGENIEGRGAQPNPVGGFNPLASYNTGSEARSINDDGDIHGSLEYRKAFMEYILRGTPLPSKFIEARAAELTTVGDIGAVIPTTILNRVIETITTEGKITSRVTQTAYQGGVSIPISEVNPVATWIGENKVSDDQKAKMSAKITFGYYLLEARIAVGLISATVSLPIFENTIVTQLNKAMLRALDTAILNGTGTDQPKGVLTYTLPTTQIATMSASTIGTVAAWAAVEAKIPEDVEDTGIYLMHKSTWELYLNGMVDKNGQKIGLGKINERGQKILNGREVLTTNKLPAFDTAKADDVFAVVVDLAQYLINSNLAMYYKKYFDDNTNKWIHKGIMIADGQLAAGNDSAGKLVGAEGVIFVKKSNTP